MNKNLSIVAPNGDEVAVVGSAVKRAHNPERVTKERLRLNTILSDMQKDWHKDRGADPLGATKPDEAAIDKHYTEKWEATARAVLAASDPIDVDVDAMRKYIAERNAYEARQRQYQLPLREVLDLTAWEFKPVGISKLGTVHLCDRAALCIDAEGCAFLALRPMATPLTVWADQDWLHHNTWVDAFELPDFTLGELFELLKLLRYTKMTALPEPLMAMARHNMVEVTSPKTSPVEDSSNAAGTL